MSFYQCLVFGHVVLASKEIRNGYIAISDGKIVCVGDRSVGIPEAHEILDFNDSYIFPAAIDAQVHSRSQKGQEDFIWSTQSAAVGGVGTIVDMPYDAGCLICNAERFYAKKNSASEQARVDFALYATVHPEEGISHIDELIKAGAVGFKLSTFGTDPERFPRINPRMMYDCMKHIAKYDLVVGVHNEDDETVKSLIKEYKDKQYTDYTAHSASRPIYAENLAIQQIYELGAETGCRAHVVHCSNSRGYDICNSFQKQGFDTTIEACLHYLILSEDEDVSRLGGRAKVNPPIRGKNEREALWKHLANGNITIVSTDHVSWSLDKKQHSNIFENSSGATGLGVLVPLLVDGAIKRDIPLSRIAQVLAYNPARLFRINHIKGALEVGRDADLVVIKKDPYIYSAGKCGYHFSNWSPYDGREINYQVVGTMVRGKWVYKDGKVQAEPGYGHFVSPQILKD